MDALSRREKEMHRSDWKNLKYSPFFLALAGLIWFLLRVVSRPSRIAYPCQRVALANISYVLGPALLPSLVWQYRRLIALVKHNYLKTIALGSAAVVLIVGFQYYQNYREDRLKIAGGRTLPAAAFVLTKQNTQTAAAQSGAGSLVSFHHDPASSYGSNPPYDQSSNPAYDLVWETVVDLGLGDDLNPLGDLIAPGNTVLIKPNLVTENAAGYTHPAVVRPLVDMAVAAGATTIYVGDGGPGYSGTETILDNTHYDELVAFLQADNPGITIETVNLNDRTHWRWINLGIDSKFAGSGYSDYDLANSNAGTMYNHSYYSTADPQGINPGGQVAGWYAIPDLVLSTDVIINVPKMKNHWTMMVTLCVKNQVGSVLCSTYDGGYADFGRVPHCQTGSSGNDYYFLNDIFWRAILDVNKILLYADELGTMQPVKQRKYLNVLDGIVANERNAGGTDPYDAHMILAGIDPVAVDAVACRLMGYDFNAVAGIKKMNLESNYPIGDHDPLGIVVIGDEIDDTFNRINMYGSGWDEFADDMNLSLEDFTPPDINHVETETTIAAVDVTAHVGNNGVASYLLCRTVEGNHIEAMDRSGNYFSAQMQTRSGDYYVLAQDQHFNSALSLFMVAFHQDITSGDIDPLMCGDTDMSMDFSSGPGGTVTVYKYDTAPPYVGTEVLPYHWDLVSDMANGSFSTVLTFSYDESEVTALGLDESELIIAYFDDSWHEMTTSVNTSNNTVSTTTTHFTRFAIGSLEGLITAVPDGDDRENAQPFTLHQNHPNPFNPSTTIRFSLDREAVVTLEIYNVSGSLVRTLVSGRTTPGSYSEDWNGRDNRGRRVASGTYFYRLRVDGRTQTKKMVLLK